MYLIKAFSKTMYNLQLWLKLLVPLEFVQKMHNFSQRIAAIKNALVYPCLFPLCTLDQHKNPAEKSHILHNFT